MTKLEELKVAYKAAYAAEAAAWVNKHNAYAAYKAELKKQQENPND
jgi:hypothetical protein